MRSQDKPASIQRDQALVPPRGTCITPKSAPHRRPSWPARCYAITAATCALRVGPATTVRHRRDGRSNGVSGPYAERAVRRRGALMTVILSDVTRKIKRALTAEEMAAAEVVRRAGPLRPTSFL